MDTQPTKQPRIDPALGLDLSPTRTSERVAGSVTVLIPAHNEENTIREVVAEAYRGLRILDVPGNVVVCASDCTDHTAKHALAAGATVLAVPRGKGAAIAGGLAAVGSSEIICLVDGDIQYFGDPPLVAILVEPILRGIADATVSDLYWRPIYPQLWLYGFFVPLAGALFPELLSKVGSTPWSGQRAALRSLWPKKLPTGFTVDLKLLLHWNDRAARLRPVLADDWVNPQRPKPGLMEHEFRLLVGHAVSTGRIHPGAKSGLRDWFRAVHERMATYRPDQDPPGEFEKALLSYALAELQKRYRGVAPPALAARG